MTWDGIDRRRRRLGILGPYLAVCAVVILGFFVQGQNTARIEREARERDRAICEDSNERAESVRLFVRLLVAPDDGSAPGERARDVITLADDVFEAKDCENPRQSPKPEGAPAS